MVQERLHRKLKIEYWGEGGGAMAFDTTFNNISVIPRQSVIFDWTIPIPLKSKGELLCYGRVISFFFTKGIYLLIHAKNLISNITDNTMAKRRRTKGQTIIYKTSHMSIMNPTKTQG